VARKTPSLLTALHDSLRAAQPDKRTTAAAALAKLYAAQLDASTPSASADDDMEMRVLRLKVLSDLGPKYLQVLTALGLPAAAPRAGSAGAPPAQSAPPAGPAAPPSAATSSPGDPPPAGGDPVTTLAELRARARQRRGGVAPA
jgi:hypothetical protein